ncbi:17950_t:CDS:2 [Funneliformis caledonium]|uniref:17950_t:CDS:1 n=1 Tax=Funneliformis caledonium TaxID=1117310 RepID=A0A9N8Z1N6_9GLOM|nr:17950_t:CDS:2 [Funneliformis caledonium]
MSDIYDIIIDLSLEKKEKSILRTHFYKNPQEINKVMCVLEKCPSPEEKIEFLRMSFLTSDDGSKHQVSAVPKRKKFSINSTIMSWDRENVYYVNPLKQSGELIDLICKGDYVLLHGARASGKSTRTMQVMDDLEEKGYICIYVAFCDLTVDDVDRFWENVAINIKMNLDSKYTEKHKLGKIKQQEPFEIPTMRTLEDIMEIFALTAKIWNYFYEEPCKKVVLFFDEFDTLLSPNNVQVCNSLLTNMRVIKTSPYYAIKSVVGIGTFSILNLNTTNRSVSPFNVSDAFQNPNFTEDEVRSIFKEFMNDYSKEIDDQVIKDIHIQTNGHAGLINLCGRLIESVPNKLDYACWKHYEHEKLGVWISNYRTFKRMIDSLKMKDAISAVNLLRTRFLGNSSDVKIMDNKELELAKFLVSEGVLIHIDSNTYKMYSSLLDSLIRRYVIADLFPLAPKIHVPKQNDKLKTLEVLKEAVRFFDREIISRAFHYSFKTAHSTVCK